MSVNFPSKRGAEGSSDDFPVKVQRSEHVISVTPDTSKVANVIGRTFHSEHDVGITEYICDLPGFSAVVKERYSDFLVNEIDLDGNIVRLTTLQEPAKEQDHVVVDSDALSESELKLIEELSSDVQKEQKVSLNVTNKGKKERQKIHELIRTKFEGLESITESSGEQKYIVVKKRTGKSRKYNPPQDGNKYTHFVLYKENKDTMNAISTISSILRLSPKVLSYAGTKDKRAKSVQCVSAFRVPAKDLLALNDKLNQIKIGNVEYKKTALKLGDLSGNRFVVVLRQLEGDLSALDKVMESLSTRGFINYYGMQRFGTTSVATHRIGRALLLGQRKEAVDLILQPRSEADDESMTEARKIWFETRDAKKAWEKLRYKDSIEARLLGGLATHKGNDVLNALNSIPRNTRLMYIHSYQSYIWNKVLSRRIQHYGLKVQLGDLVFAGGSADIGHEDMDSIDNLNLMKIEPKILTAENLNESTIYDVILPLPGHNIKYPENEMKAWYEEFLKEDGMDFDTFKSKVKSYTLGGAYRKILVKPTEMKWETVPYDDNTIPLVLSDWEILKGDTLPCEGGGNQTALKLEFCLPPSSYATMAIREILKGKGHQ